MVFTSDLPTALSNAATVEFLHGLAAVCESTYTSMLLICAADAGPAGMTTSVRDAVVDGFVVYSLRDDDPILPAIRARQLPMVIVDAPREVAGIAWVGIDDAAAISLLGDHLHGLGHRHLGIIAPQLNDSRQNGRADPDRWRHSGHTLMRVRIEGLLASMQLDARAVPVEERFEASAAAGADALHSLLDAHPELTAVCCLTDELALGALVAARQRGLRVGWDLTITGFDDIAEAARVGLTTITQAHREKGRSAGELYLGAGGAGAQPPRRTLPTHLQIRSSSGPARHAG